MKNIPVFLMVTASVLSPRSFARTDQTEPLNKVEVRNVVGGGGGAGVTVVSDEKPKSDGQVDLQDAVRTLGEVTLQPKVANTQIDLKLQDLNEQLTLFNYVGQGGDLNLVPADDAIRAHLDLPKDQGLVVMGLAANSPAAQAGLQQNDVLLKVGETALTKPEDLEVGLKASGDKAAVLTVIRAGKKTTVQVQPRIQVTMGPVAPKAPAFWIGVTVSDIEPALRSQLALPKDQGLLTLQVHEGSPAAKAEVKVHDILLSLADKPLDSREKLTETVQASGEKAVPLKLIRGGKTLTIEVTPQRRKTEKLTVNTNVVLSQPLSYYIVRPGTFVSSPVNLQEPRSVIATQAPPVKMIEPQESAELARRLTAVDEEIKQLRKTIEELSKNLKDHK